MKLSSKFYAFIINGLIYFLGLAPLSIRRNLGRFLGNIFYKFTKKERKIAELQLKKILKTKHSLTISKRMFQFFGQMFLESINLKPILSNSNNLIQVNNPDLWHDLLKSKQAIIALTAHTANWDLLASYVVQSGGKIVTIGRPARSEVLQACLKNLREKNGIKTIWRNSLADTKKLLEVSSGTSSEATILGVLVDQDLKIKSRASSFFDLECKTPTNLLELGLKNKARIVSAFLFQEKDSSYRVYIAEYFYDPNQPIDSLLDQILNSYHQDLARLIQIYPEQWVWFHKRWRSKKLADIKNSFYTMSNQEYLKYLESL